jgi:protoheme IX farnesyltransferase
MTRVYRLALAAVLATLAIVAFGSVARLLPAGSGCGNDWPRCNGSWLPPLGWAPLVEYGHRLAALSVIALSVFTVVAAFRSPEAPTRVRVLASVGVATILIQSAIGGATARWGAPPGIATLHLLTAMLFLGAAVLTLAAAAAWRGAPAWLAALGRAPAPTADRPFAFVASLGAVAALGLVLFGASTSASGAFACAAWPLCAGVEGDAIVHLGYRATALLGAFAAAGSAVVAWRRAAAPVARGLAALAVGLVVAQTLLNAAAAALGDPAWTSAPHLWIAATLWVAMLGLAATAWGPRPAHPLGAPGVSIPTHSIRTGHAIPPAPVVGGEAALAVAPPLAAPGIALDFAPFRGLRPILADYVALTKPGIMTLLLTTTLCAMLIAARGLPPFWLVAVTLLGGVFAAGGANVLNCYLDRDIDGQMSRTRNRAIVAGRVSPDAALAYGVVLTVAAVLLLGLAVNWTAAWLALAGNLFYVFVYTKWLKRSTPYNIVIGGAAGAVPPLVGWAAVTGDLSPLAWGLFAIVFAWTPPHFWALALLKQGEYTRAAVPMLPVVRGEAETRRQIVLYTVVLAAVCLALVPFGLGALYLVAALILNGIFLRLALQLYRAPSKRLARQTFFYSLWYLAFLFAAAVIDRMVVF